MTNQEIELMNKVWAYIGRLIAEDLESRAPDMTANEIVDSAVLLPEFNPARQYLNFEPGYVCRSSMGNAVKLIQPYDSTIYTDEPEYLTAQWGFYWSTDPKQAKPFVKSSTSPYQVDDCCTFEDHVWRSKIPSNVWSPSENSSGWEDLGPVNAV